MKHIEWISKRLKLKGINVMYKEDECGEDVKVESRVVDARGILEGAFAEAEKEIESKTNKPEVDIEEKYSLVEKSMGRGVN